MGYIGNKSREDIDTIISNTLSHYYDSNIKIESKYKSGGFILNPRLNCAITKRAGLSVRKFVKNGHAVRKNRIVKLLADIYISISFQTFGLFGCKYINIEKEFPNNDQIMIMPGNMKVKVFDFGKKEITNIIKTGFSKDYFSRELKVRMNTEWPFVLPVLSTNDTSYKESLIEGCSLDRVPDKTADEVMQIVKSYLYTIQKTNRRIVNINVYSKELVEVICKMISQTTWKKSQKEGLAKFAEKIQQEIGTGDIVISASHGDLQKGNVFVSERKVYILDWETFDTRSVGYDLLTFLYSLRYRDDFANKLNIFMKDESFNVVEQSFFPETNVSKKQLLIIYLLEDLCWYVKETMQTPERKITVDLLQYLDSKLQTEIINMIKFEPVMDEEQ